MTVRRVLLAIAMLIAAASVVVAFMPFHSPGAQSFDPPIDTPTLHAPGIHGYSIEEVTDGSRRKFCGPPIIDAWHSKPFRWHVQANAPGSHADFTATATGSPCRKRAGQRASLAGFGVFTAAVVAFCALFFGRRRGGESTAPTE